MKVVMDIFSGRPNPTWEVDETQLPVDISDLPLYSTIENHKLGYGGLIIDGKFIAVNTNTVLEEWLLSQAPADVKHLLGIMS